MYRTSFFRWRPRALAAALVMTSLAAPALASAADLLAFVGTFMRGQSKGVYALRLQTKAGTRQPELVSLGLAAETANPGFIDLDPQRRVLFVANDLPEFEGKPSGAISAFAIDTKSGKLTLINQQASGAAAPCHLTLDRSRRQLLVAHCLGGGVAVLPVARDGRLGPPSQVLQHPGTKPHTHGVTLSPDNRFAFACDMGLDRVMVYAFDANKGTLSPAATPVVQVKAGTGPRHIAFRPDGRFAYVVGTPSSSLVTFAYDAKTGALREVQSISSLPPSTEAKNSAAEVMVHPSGKFLYVSNRGHNSVSLFQIDKQDGTLTFVADQATGGKTPRHFSLDDRGAHLAVGNQESDTVFLYRVDPRTGRLDAAGLSAPVPMPTAVRMLPARR